MKKNAFLFVLLGCLLGFSACKSKKSENVTFEFKTHAESLVFRFFNDDSHPAYRLEIKFICPSSSSDEQVLKNVVPIFIKECFGEAYMDLQPEAAWKQYTFDFLSYCTKQEAMYKQDLEAAGFDREKLGISQYVHEEIITDTIIMNRDNLLSFICNTFIYSGGAHGSSTEKACNIDVKSGKVLTLEDIFIENKSGEISDLLLNNLMTMKNVATIEDLKSENYSVKDIIPNNNFLIDEKGVTFIYGQYEIAPYYLGISKILIPYNELKPYIKKESLLYSIAESF